MEEKKVKGSILKGFISFISRTWGKNGLEEFYEGTRLRKDSIKDKTWYSIEHLKYIHKWLAEEKGQTYLRRAGRFTVQDLGVLSYLVKFTSIETLLKKAPKSYRDAFSYGRVSIDIGEEEAIVKMKGVVVDEYTCIGWRGVFEGSLKATGTDGVVEHIDPPEKEENDCYFKIEW